MAGMELYLLRHGIAEEGHSGLTDEHRKLTPEGRRKLREILRVAFRAGVSPSCILTSPLLRAVETAELAAEELKYSGELIRTDQLIPEADPRNSWEEIRLYRDQPQVLLASHNPLCASLAGYLLGAPSLVVEYRKGALLRVDFDSFGAEPRGVLRWFLTPKLAGL
jgi:phosphohistidine phosphatase